MHTRLCLCTSQKNQLQPRKTRYASVDVTKCLTRGNSRTLTTCKLLADRTSTLAKMSITQACLNIYFLLQKLIRPPLLIDQSSLICYNNPSYDKNFENITKTLPSILFKFCGQTIWYCFVYAQCRIIWLFKHWGTHADYEQTAFNFLFGTVALIALAAMNVYVKHPVRMSYVVTQRFKLERTFPRGKIKKFTFII